MCTVVCRWSPHENFPIEMLALRDEKRSRSFDRPGPWWPELTGAIGGRDRKAGGSWCVSSIETGATAVVLNRPDHPDAAPQAPSRGALVLLATEHGADWPQHVELSGMASFNLVLAAPGELRWWWFDGTSLSSDELPAGTHVFKPKGLVTEEVDDRLLAGRAQLGDLSVPTDAIWADWLEVLRASTPSEDSDGLLVRKPLDDGDSYETVFAQLIAARAGVLRLDYLVDPAAAGDWTSAVMRR